MSDVNVNFPPISSPVRGVTAGDMEAAITQIKADVEGRISEISTQVGNSNENKFSYVYNDDDSVKTITEKDKNDIVVSVTAFTYTNGDVTTTVKTMGDQTVTTQYIYDENGNLTDTINTKS